MFSNAYAYERYMGRWSARLAPLFADFVGIPDGGRVLDVGCGTAALAQVVADRARRAEIVGVDPALPFVAFARERLSTGRAAFQCGRAGELPYRDASFDLSLSLLVLQLIPGPERAVAEMRRVTRPSGTVAACAWDGRGLELASLLWEEAARLDPQGAEGLGRGRRITRDGQLAALWRATGLSAVEEVAIEIPTEFASFDDYWLPVLAGVGPVGAYVSGLTPGGRDALREAMRARLLAGRPDGPITLSARAWAVRGTVPQ